MTPLERLFALEQFGIKLGLDNIRAILAALGNPERAWRSVHIAGTNGKGSVAAMVERGLRAAGTHDRPLHLAPPRSSSKNGSRINGEHRRPGDRCCGDRRRAAGVRCAGRPVATRDGTLTVVPTFFEVSTAVAFEIFKRAGQSRRRGGRGRAGRAGSTPPTCCRPTITAITSIAFDHERHLGATLVADCLREGRHCQARHAAGDRPAAGRGGAARIAEGRARAVERAADTMRTPPTTDRVYPKLKLVAAGPPPARERRGRGGDSRNAGRRAGLASCPRRCHCHRPHRLPSGRHASSG